MDPCLPSSCLLTGFIFSGCSLKTSCAWAAILVACHPNSVTLPKWPAPSWTVVSNMTWVNCTITSSNPWSLTKPASCPFSPKAQWIQLKKFLCMIPWTLMCFNPIWSTHWHPWSTIVLRRVHALSNLPGCLLWITPARTPVICHINSLTRPNFDLFTKQ